VEGGGGRWREVEGGGGRWREVEGSDAEMCAREKLKDTCSFKRSQKI
jgi:hypothetical protein